MVKGTLAGWKKWMLMSTKERNEMIKQYEEERKRKPKGECE